MQNITFINAGAGSGKTYSLTAELVKMIQEGNYQAHEVILTTFTDKAASEFNAKAREALISAGLPDQANLLTSAAIGTVHSVAFSLLKEYWYHTGLGVDLNVLPKEDTDFFINQALANVPSSDEIEQLSDFMYELEFKNSYGGIDEDYWKSQLLGLINLALSFQITDFEGCRRRSLEEIDKIYPQKEIDFNHNLIREQLTILRSLLQNEKESGTRNKLIDSVTSLIQRNEFKVPELRRVHSIYQDLGVRRVEKAAESIRNLRETMNDLSELHCSTLVVSVLKNYTELLFDLTSRSITYYKEYKKNQKLIDFNDMELYFLELLRNKDVEDDLKKRCKLVFVDEFQDSSPVQVQIFTRLSELAEQSFWVGDPKQAIFNFRGTDPVLIQKIIREFEENDERNLKVKNLEYSWRSRPQLVKLNNTIFKEALASQVANPEHISLKPVRGQNELPNDEIHFGLRHWHFEDNIRQKKENFNAYLSATLEEYLNTEGRTIVDKHKSHYNLTGENVIFKRGIDPQDIAVLRHTNNNVAALARSLKLKGIRSSAKLGGVLMSAEIQLLIACLNYLLDERDSLAKASILMLSGPFNNAGDLIDNRLEHIHQLGVRPEKTNDGLEVSEEYMNYYRQMNSWGNEDPLIGRLDQIRQEIRFLDVPGIIQTLIAKVSLSDEVSKWDEPDQRKQNLQIALHMAKSYDQRCLLLNIGASIRGYIEFLNISDTNGTDQPTAGGGEALTVCTYHKSKGLEWPVVILTDLDTNRIDESNMIRRTFHGVCRYMESEIDLDNPFNGQVIILLPWPFGSKETVPGDVANRILQSERYQQMYRLEEEETKRLMYVGMTRARDFLITTSFKGLDTAWLNQVLGHTNFKKNVTSSNLELIKIDLFEKGQEILLERKFFDAEEETIEKSVPNAFIYKKNGLTIPDDPKFRSPSQESYDNEVSTSVVRDFNFRIEVGKALETSDADLGNCLHDIFYHFQPGSEQKSSVGLAEKIISNFGFTGLLPKPAHTFASIANLHNFLAESFGEPLKIYHELPLQMAENGYVYRGEADLVWETIDGLVLVDYKSYPGAKDHVVNPAHEKYSGRYAGQLLTYKRMLEAAHPLKKKVLEIFIYYAVIGLIVKLEF